ncbi:helix-turn-helix transcriptional regulator [Bradyrhizobium sp. 153]|uniref:helix-turn-helix transcriptional regulator n=1 Tax=Bradyrhizobium sp. 153 TaxID=2782627 RepID=UPI001FFB0424|nr:helix-turn-helix transcriptional regulator [Bradyrhizobium sp. 153]MCK1668609.1 helix-turn-helix transcriptional regulator [Bradyrhizobium sp. 153]
MDAREFNAVVERLKFRNQEHVAESIGVTLRTVNGYANGGTIPEPVARLLRLMDRLKVNPDSVR